MYKQKILTHLAIILVVIFISLENFDTAFSLASLKNFIISIFMFTSIIYFNIKVLVPKFLFRNKFWRYILFMLLGICLFMTAFVFLSQPMVADEKNIAPSSDYAPFTIVIVLSTIIKLGFIISGTTVFMLFEQWTIHNQRISALENATIQSELDQLKNQINPHFLFNMLNNINELTKESPDEAANVLFKLKGLLKYQLNDSVKDEVLLQADIEFLTDFLNLEKIRRDNFEFIISTEGDLTHITVPPLLFIPFVENAVKHGNDKRSYIHLYFKVENKGLDFICINSKPQEIRHTTDKGGLGLSNIKRRLELLYGQDYSLNISENEITYRIKLHLNL